MYVGDIKTLQVSSELEYTVKSENEFITTITENKNVKGEHVGKTTITITNGKKTEICEIEVLAKYTPFAEPFIPNYTTNSCEWLTMSNYNDSHGFEFLQGNDEYQIYAGKESNVYIYYFLDSNLKITEMQIRFYNLDLWQQLYNYTNERFQLVSSSVLGNDGNGGYYYEDIFCNALYASKATLNVTLGNSYTDGTNRLIALIFTPK